MRSKTIASLVSKDRDKTFQLIDGYKKFREFIRDALKDYIPPFKLIVLQGFAGCGKTDLIKSLSPSIDLEGFAKHRSSLFGALGLKPVSQKMFESRLWFRLQELKDEKVVFIEGEAKKIGNLFVPDKLFQSMSDSPTILIYSSLESRSKRIVRDYFTHNEDNQIKEIISKLKEHLSSRVVDELHLFVDNKKYEEVATVLLRDYYDHQYAYALQKTKYYYSEVCTDDLDSAVSELNLIKKDYS